MHIYVCINELEEIIHIAIIIMQCIVLTERNRTADNLYRFANSSRNIRDICVI